MRNPGSRAATLAVLVLIVLTGCGDDDQPLAPDGDTWQHDGTLLVHSQLAVEALAGVREIDGALRIVGREGEDPIVDLSPLASLQRVKELEISGTEITSLHGLEGLTEIDSLFTLQLNHLLASCAALADLRGVPAVVVCGNPQLESLAPLGGIENLVSLSILFQHRLTTADVFADLSGLEYLKVMDCAVLTGLPLDQPLPMLRELRLLHLPALTRVALGAHAMPHLVYVLLGYLSAAGIDGPLIEPSLTSLELASLPLVHDFTWLGAAPRLEHLSCWQMSGLGSFAGATDLSSLSELRIDGVTPITDLASLPALPSLTDLHLALETSTMTTFAGMPGLPLVERVELAGFPQVEHLGGLPSMPALTSLVVRCRGLVDLTGLATLTNCGKLEVFSCSHLTSLEGLASFTALRELTVAYCSQLSTFGPQATLPYLEALDLVACESLISLQSKPNAPVLADVRLTDCDGLVDLTGSAFPASLDTLEVRYNEHLTSLAGLESVQEVRRYLELDANDSVTSLAGLSGLATAGDVTISANPNLSTPSIFAFLQGIDVLGRVTVEGNGP